MSAVFGAGVEPGEQGSIEWLSERVGSGTGSRFDDVTAKQKTGKPSASRETYMLELVMERVTGRPSDHYFSSAMQWGLDHEAEARMCYEARTGSMVLVPGFQKHPTIPWCGVSSDGLVADAGTIEIKCPANPRNHLKTLLYGMPSEHMAQVQGGLWVWGRTFSDFISYDPRWPEPHNLFVQRVVRDTPYIVNLEAELIVFLREVSAIVAKLQGEPK